MQWPPCVHRDRMLSSGGQTLATTQSLCHSKLTWPTRNRAPWCVLRCKRDFTKHEHVCQPNSPDARPSTVQQHPGRRLLMVRSARLARARRWHMLPRFAGSKLSQFDRVTFTRLPSSSLGLCVKTCSIKSQMACSKMESKDSPLCRAWRGIALGAT